MIHPKKDQLIKISWPIEKWFQAYRYIGECECS